MMYLYSWNFWSTVFEGKFLLGRSEKKTSNAPLYMVYSCECFPAVEAATKGLAKARKCEQIMSECEGEGSIRVLLDDLNM